MSKHGNALYRVHAEVTALTCACICTHMCRHMHVHAPPAFAALKDPTTHWRTAILRGKQGFSCGREKSRLDHYIREPG